MFEPRAVRQAKRRYEQARLEREMFDNQQRLREIEEQRKRPCPCCVERGWIKA